MTEREREREREGGREEAGGREGGKEGAREGETDRQTERESAREREREREREICSLSSVSPHTQRRQRCLRASPLRCRHRFSKVLSTAPFNKHCTRTLTFQNV